MNKSVSHVVLSDTLTLAALLAIFHPILRRFVTQLVHERANCAVRP